MNNRDDHFDLLIIGAGPGGIAAAVTAAEAGRSVGLIDDGAFAGGQIWRNRGGSTVPRAASKWIERLQRCDRITWLRQSRVVARPAASQLLVETPAGPRKIGWEKLILATGARELFLPFPGWTLPGVVGAGGIQALVKQGLSVAGKRIVVGGTGPLLLAVADLLRSKGAIVPLILEQAPAGRINRFAMSLFSSPTKLLAAGLLRGRLFRTRYATGSYATRVERSATGLQVEYRRGDAIETIDCDYFACGFNLIPNIELPQLLHCELTQSSFVKVDAHCQTTAADVYAIGELTGIGGVDKALVEGQLAAFAAMNEPAADRFLSQRAAWLRFTQQLSTAFALRDELKELAKPETVVCRCEDVTLAAVQNAISGRDAKLQTRCGMGPCQGRVCGPILHHVRGYELPQVRPPVVATTIGTLAGCRAPQD